MGMRRSVASIDRRLWVSFENPNLFDEDTAWSHHKKDQQRAA
jgi:hypothetical protein